VLLQQQGAAAGHVILVTMKLGTCGIIASIYLWREVSKRLAALLFVLFVASG
jgi:hypothetical protein